MFRRPADASAVPGQWCTGQANENFKRKFLVSLKTFAAKPLSYMIKEADNTASWSASR
jgi:hypothetical protein